MSCNSQELFLLFSVVVEGTSLEISAALFPRYVPKNQEQNRIYTQSGNLYFPAKK